MPEDSEKSKIPQLLKTWDDAELWYKKDDRFSQPKGYVGMKYYTSDILFGASPHTRVFAEVWKLCFEEFLREYTYMAECASLKLSIVLAHDNVNI